MRNLQQQYNDIKKANQRYTVKGTGIFVLNTDVNISVAMDIEIPVINEGLVTQYDLIRYNLNTPYTPKLNKVTAVYNHGRDYIQFEIVKFIETGTGNDTIRVVNRKTVNSIKRHFKFFEPLPVIISNYEFIKLIKRAVDSLGDDDGITTVFHALNLTAQNLHIHETVLNAIYINSISYHDNAVINKCNFIIFYKDGTKREFVAYVTVYHDNPVIEFSEFNPRDLFAKQCRAAGVFDKTLTTEEIVDNMLNQGWYPVSAWDNIPRIPNSAKPLLEDNVEDEITSDSNVMANIIKSIDKNSRAVPDQLKVTIEYPNLSNLIMIPITSDNASELSSGLIKDEINFNNSKASNNFIATNISNKADIIMEHLKKGDCIHYHNTESIRSVGVHWIDHALVDYKTTFSHVQVQGFEKLNCNFLYDGKFEIDHDIVARVFRNKKRTANSVSGAALSTIKNDREGYKPTSNGYNAPPSTTSEVLAKSNYNYFIIPGKLLTTEDKIKQLKLFYQLKTLLTKSDLTICNSQYQQEFDTIVESILVYHIGFFNHCLSQITVNSTIEDFLKHQPVYAWYL